MSNHSIIEHRANYHFFKIEEDYIQICTFGEQYPQCKAAILAVLEHWMNDKRAKGQDNYVYMTYPEWIDALYGLFRRNTIIACLSELVQEQLITRREVKRYGKITFEYTLNTNELQERLKGLPERDTKSCRPNLNASKFKRVQKQTDPNLNGDTHPNLNASEHEDASKSKRNIDSLPEIPSNIDSDSSLSNESDSATTNMTDLEKWKEDTDKRKTVSLRVATTAIGNTEGQDTEQVIIRPVLTIGAKHGSDRDTIVRNNVRDGDFRDSKSQGAAGNTHRTAPATPEIRPAADQGVGERDLQQTLIASQQTIPIPVAGEQQPAPQSTAPPPTASTSHAGSGGAPVASGQEPKPKSLKPRIRKTVIVKEQAGPPPFPPESQEWGTRTCVALFDFWRGAPKLDLGQIKHDSHCAKEMSTYYTRKQVVLARTAMSNSKYWKDRGGCDLCDVAHHIHEELNKLKIPTQAPALSEPPDQSQAFLEDEQWQIWKIPGDPTEYTIWRGEFMTLERAETLGYNGGFGLYA